MPRLPRTLLFVIRALAVAELLIGLLLWAGSLAPWRGVHLALGGALGATLLALGAVAARAAGRAHALLVAAAWTALLVAYGLGHPRLLPGSAHWIAQLLHVLIGLATLGVAGRVAAAGRAVVVPPRSAAAAGATGTRP